MPDGCGSYTNSFAYVQLFGQAGCYPLLPAVDGEPSTKATDIMSGNTEEVNGIKLSYSTGYEKCPSNPDKQLKLTVELECAQNYLLTPVESDEGDECDIVLKYKSNMGCPKF